jgi:hypothetical protein
MNRLLWPLSYAGVMEQDDELPGALPLELWEEHSEVDYALHDLLVGPGGLEPPTSRSVDERSESR